MLFKPRHDTAPLEFSLCAPLHAVPASPDLVRKSFGAGLREAPPAAHGPMEMPHRCRRSREIIWGSAGLAPAIARGTPTAGAVLSWLLCSARLLELVGSVRHRFVCPWRESVRQRLADHGDKYSCRPSTCSFCVRERTVRGYLQSYEKFRTQPCCPEDVKHDACHASETST